MSKNKGKILIVDDNVELLSALKMFLSQHFETVDAEKDPEHLPSLLQPKRFDLILLDMNFRAGISTGNEGFYWMKKIREKDPDVTVVFITAYGDVELAVKSLKEGATDFIQKSWDEDKILSTVLSAYKLHQSQMEVKMLRNRQNHLAREIEQEHSLYRCRSQVMQRVYELVDKVGPTDADILITGENGTGKEVIAREIHKKSLRKGEIFLNVDLGALPESLFESELFGHVKGAFTDAREPRQGKFEAASGGTLFLDEIGNLPITLQAKLLSTLQNRSVVRVGSNHGIAVDIRLICATNQPLFDMIEEGSFREDLLYRINTIQIDVPPLRDRPKDIPGLAEFFLSRLRDKYRKPGLLLTDKGIEIMQQYSWPGNIRELEHAIEKAVILCEDDELNPDLLVPERNPATSAALPTFNLEENEKQIIASALKQFRGNISLTAKKLGIDRSTLYTKIRKYGLQ
ncbi:MAG: sigma-54-dependent Fis family transcriptional regulator [Bacteroidales bacterium]|nr:sigma-54-dependent Fis family transcriptional regulator [Bacteroidales bacterium]